MTFSEYEGTKILQNPVPQGADCLVEGEHIGGHKFLG